MLAARAADGIDGLPRDEHRHDRGLARAGGELQREAHQFGIGVFVRCGKMLEHAFPGGGCGATSVSQMAVSTASTWQKNGRTLAKLVMPPVLEQTGGFGCDLPCLGSASPPLVHVPGEPR